MNDLLLESTEISGARKLLEKLSSEWVLSVIPSVKCRVKVDERRNELGIAQPDYEYFPIERSLRKLAGEGMVRFLLAEKENMRRFLYDDVPLYARYVRNDKGKVVRIDIYTK